MKFLLFCTVAEEEGNIPEISSPRLLKDTSVDMGEAEQHAAHLTIALSGAFS